MIVVLDYGIGNLASAHRALRHIGADARLVREPAEAHGATGVVLPGVGNFGACATALRESGLDEVVRDAVRERTPLLGICVGLQLLYEESEESAHVPGLGILEGSVRRLSGEMRLPQMQWNTIDAVAGRSSKLLRESTRIPWFYFVHSYAPVPSPAGASTVVATCEYGGEVAAVVESENCFGTQFHPEKSAKDGLALLSSFASLCEESNT
ncbi:MAG: imidazole glycerol phosphate synthase subunit HisH [Acidimicrobiales bacterium]